MIIITICKSDPEGLLKTSNSIIEAVDNGLKLSLWVIKLSSEGDDSLTLMGQLPSFCLVSKQSDSSIYNALNQAVDIIPERFDSSRVMLLHANDLFFEMMHHELKYLNELNHLSTSEVIIGKAKSDTGCNIAAIPMIVGVGGLNFCHQAALFKVKALKETPFPLDFRIAGDYAQFIAMKKPSIEYIDLNLVIFDLNGISSVNVLDTRLDNFKAGYSIYGYFELPRLFFMLLVRFVRKCI